MRRDDLIDEYAKNVRRVERFLSGQRRELTNELKVDMADAAASLDFERAGRIKRRLEVIDGLDDRQQVVFPTGVDLDLIGFYREETIAGACVFWCERDEFSARASSSWTKASMWMRLSSSRAL